jgi:hypothetical protein
MGNLNLYFSIAVCSHVVNSTVRKNGGYCEVTQHMVNPILNCSEAACSDVVTTRKNGGCCEVTQHMVNPILSCLEAAYSHVVNSSKK